MAKIKSGQKVKVLASQLTRYEYGLECLTTGGVYEVVTGFGEEAKDAVFDNRSIPTYLADDEFEIVNDDGEVCWSTMHCGDKPLFEIME